MELMPIMGRVRETWNGIANFTPCYRCGEILYGGIKHDRSVSEVQVV